MTPPRRSGRLASQSQNASPPQKASASPATGKKRKTNVSGDSPSAKRGKKVTEPEQKTLEETLNGNEKEQEDQKTTEEQPQPPQDTQNGDTSGSAGKEDGTPAQAQSSANGPAMNGETAESNGNPREDHDGDVKMGEDVSERPSVQETLEKKDEPSSSTNEENKEQDTEKAPVQEDVETKGEPSLSTNEEAKEQGAEKAPVQEAAEKMDEVPAPTEAEKNEPPEETGQPTQSNGSAVVPEARTEDVPSSILEKGVVYFFFRARVNVDEPHDVGDIARSYLIMRPLPKDAKLGEGPVGDEGNCRLLALPKKVLPKSGKDRFMTFVEKAKTSFKDLKEDFMTGSDYATKTAGTSHSPPATPVAEGVYAITTTGRESHLAYVITIPDHLGEVQKDIGLQQRGSFVTSVKNPDAPAPSNTSLPHGPEFPREILDEFHGRRWMPMEPKHLNYANTQFLLIGESFEHGVEQIPKDGKEDKSAEKEMDRLEGEDEIRVKHLKGDDAVFADLGISAKDFPKVPTTW